MNPGLFTLQPAAETGVWFVNAGPAGRSRPSTRRRLRLFCFPYAGGGASIFHQWPQLLPGHIDVWAVQPPGREHRMRARPFTDLKALVEALYEAIRPHLGQPFAFLGHSMGSLVAFELARTLRRHGEPAPRFLIVSGRRAPHLPDTTRKPPMHPLPDDAFVERLHELNGTPPDVLAHAELMRLLLPTLRADFQAVETYAYREEPPLSCPVAAFGGLKDKDISRAQVAEWRAMTRGPFSLHMFPGDHFFVNTDRQAVLEVVARKLLQRPGLAG